MKKKIHWALSAVLAAALCEGIAALAFLTVLPQFEKTRQILSGEVPLRPLYQNTIPQPYLLYIPAPNFKNEKLTHNAMGWRGEAVELSRREGYKRILFLVGSTTYGILVGDDSLTYPAQVKSLLEQDPPPEVRGVEVINGGLQWGTTAECLTHYLFKYSYFDADLVVINVGGNDAQAEEPRYYHPDYSHWRQQMQADRRLPPLGRLLLRSRLVSAFLVPIVSGPQPNRSEFVRSSDEPPPALWFPPERMFSIDEEHLAFRSNLKKLIGVIRMDGAKVLLVPFRENPKSSGLYVERVEKNERRLLDIAKELDVAVAPFPAAVISKENWGDHCHLDERGSLEKAQHVLPYVKDLIYGEEKRESN